MDTLESGCRAVMDKYKVLKFSKENLEDSIAGLSGIKPMLQNLVREINGRNKKQADFDVKEMVTMLVFMENKD